MTKGSPPGPSTIRNARRSTPAPPRSLLRRHLPALALGAFAFAIGASPAAGQDRSGARRIVERAEWERWSPRLSDDGRAVVGSLVGAGVGVALGAAVGAGICRGTETDLPRCAAVGGGLALPVGALAGWAVSGDVGRGWPAAARGAAWSGGLALLASVTAVAIGGRGALTAGVYGTALGAAGGAVVGVVTREILEGM